MTCSVCFVIQVVMWIVQDKSRMMSKTSPEKMKDKYIRYRYREFHFTLTADADHRLLPHMTAKTISTPMTTP